MSRDRSRMTVRVVPLTSREAGESRVEGTLEERVALVGKLSEMLWAQTGKPRPSYTRATMPIRVVRNALVERR